MTALEHLHGTLRWIVLAMGIWTIIRSMGGLNGGREFTSKDKRPALFLLISVDLQLLLGIALYISRGYHRAFSGGAMGDVMKDSVARFWTIEHVIGMLVAIVLIHVGYAGIKGNRPAKKKFNRLFWCTLIALILILAMIPWPFRMDGIARPWF
ncbi:MAG: hypothetical protein JST36_09150 [Bacteroidetes bacterium]|nr:hypothetical protein [Bacteroidota bacterium]